ncbi:fatty acid hydroxylase superfamily-domain-containing protein [Hyaloraphidium curvatum]|nr:fatty acid hydroxylase superfamily-domain-containing protein [Hyaloraphidium curvatum]
MANSTASAAGGTFFGSLEASYNSMILSMVATVGEPFTYALCGFVVSEIAVIPLTILFTLFDKYDGPWRKYKIIQNKFAPKDLEAKAFRSLIEGRHFTNILQDALVYWLFFQGRISLTGLPKSFGSLVGDVLPVILISDFFGYWYHRTVHENPKLYKYLHKQHHEFNVCSVYASFYGGAIEGAFQSYPGTYILPYIMKNSLFAQLCTRFLAELFNLHEHLAYQFPWDPLNWWPFLGVEFHDYHHSHNVGNYSLTYFRFWDDLFGGTNAKYLSWKKAKAAGQKVTSLETTYEPEKTDKAE